jgi:sugar phosphate isomerase/epimerase
MEPCHDLAARKGITMLLENHFDLRNEDPERTDVVREPELTARFLDALDVPHVRVNFDAGNVYTAGIEPWPYGYRILRDYIAYAHLKGMARFSEKLHGSEDQYETLSDTHAGTYIPVAVGDDGINYRGLLMEMEWDGTAKYAAFEDHAREEHAERVFERGAAFAREAIEAARSGSP